MADYGGSPSIAAGESLCTVADIKSRGEITATSSDDLIADLIETLVPTLRERYGREFMPRRTEPRTFPVRSGLVVFDGCDLYSVTSVVLHPESTSPRTLAPNVDYVLREAVTLATSDALRLASGTNISSTFAKSFGYAQVTVTGAWGCFATATDVPHDIAEAAIETVLSWLDKPVSDIAAIDSSDPMRRMPGIGSTWDIPASAHRKFVLHAATPLGVY